MINDKHFETILSTLAEKLTEQSQTIGYQQLRIDLLEQKIKEAEAEKI